MSQHSPRVRGLYLPFSGALIDGDLEKFAAALLKEYNREDGVDVDHELFVTALLRQYFDPLVDPRQRSMNTAEKAAYNHAKKMLLAAQSR